MSVNSTPDSLLADKERFPFGENWTRFLRCLDEQRVNAAVVSLKEMLEVGTLEGMTFVDVGSGSGLFSLAACRLGAAVHSFDYDPASVACTTELRSRYSPSHATWTVEQGSILDQDYLGSLGAFDIVYSWGVLHHTGQLWQAVENAAGLVDSEGLFFIAIYNDQGVVSRYWTLVKRLYNSSRVGRCLVIASHAPYLLVGRYIARVLQGKQRSDRGMTLWYDMLDWLGGYPFEVASPDAVIRHAAAQGFQLRKVTTCGNRHGCNQFVFYKQSTTP